VNPRHVAFISHAWISGNRQARPCPRVQPPAYCFTSSAITWKQIARHSARSRLSSSRNPLPVLFELHAKTDRSGFARKGKQDALVSATDLPWQGCYCFQIRTSTQPQERDSIGPPKATRYRTVPISSPRMRPMPVSIASAHNRQRRKPLVRSVTTKYQHSFRRQQKFSRVASA